jgi:hypothetical protein
MVVVTAEDMEAETVAVRVEKARVEAETAAETVEAVKVEGAWEEARVHHILVLVVVLVDFALELDYRLLLALITRLLSVAVEMVAHRVALILELLVLILYLAPSLLLVVVLVVLIAMVAMVALVVAVVWLEAQQQEQEALETRPLYHLAKETTEKP